MIIFWRLQSAEDKMNIYINITFTLTVEACEPVIIRRPSLAERYEVRKEGKEREGGKNIKKGKMVEETFAIASWSEANSLFFWVFVS